MSTPLEDYALIGDCETAALVSRGGSIDWLCWPRFDSAACFAALLGTPDHGRWLLEARDSRARISRRYRPNTLILETTFDTDEGAVTVIDFMIPARAPVGRAGRGGPVPGRHRTAFVTFDGAALERVGVRAAKTSTSLRVARPVDRERS